MTCIDKNIYRQNVDLTIGKHPIFPVFHYQLTMKRYQ